MSPDIVFCIREMGEFGLSQLFPQMWEKQPRSKDWKKTEQLTEGLCCRPSRGSRGRAEWREAAERKRKENSPEYLL